MLNESQINYEGLKLTNLELKSQVFTKKLAFIKNPF
jgi:hypothetical protein